MAEFMKMLLSLSISGTLLLFLILGLKKLYKDKFSRRWQYYIWLAVALRFLLPFAPDTINAKILLESLYTAGMAEEAPARPQAGVMENPGSNWDKTSTAGRLEQPNGNGAKQVWQAEEKESIYCCLFFVWTVTALALFLRKIRIYQRFIQCVRTGNEKMADMESLKLLSDCEEKLNIKINAGLYRNASVASPIMVGFFCPSIVLPARDLEEQELSLIFTHELLHYKQRDMFYKWLVQLVICIHWFNPFVYLLEKEVNKACELSCDEAVISMLDVPARHKYGDMLISFLKPMPHRKGTFTSVTLTEGAEQLKERLGAIMNFKKKTKGIQILTCVLTLCIISWAAFLGVSPGTPVTGPDSAGTGKPPTPGEKNPKDSASGSDTVGTDLPYRNLNGSHEDKLGDNCDNKDRNDGWNWDAKEPNDNGNYDNKEPNDNGDWDWDDEDLDDDWDWDWDDKDLDDDWDWDWDDKALLEAYAAHGIEKNGKSYYYRGDLVYIIKDQRPDSSFYLLDTNSKGTVSIKVIRNAEGDITGVSYMAKEEVEELMPRLLGTS